MKVFIQFLKECSEQVIKVINLILDLIERIFNYIKNITYKIKEKYYKVDLKNITKYEKEIINKFYVNKLSEYTSGGVVIRVNNDNDAIITKLIDRNIFLKQDELQLMESYNGDGSLYYLTKRAVKKLNKQLKKKI